MKLETISININIDKPWDGFYRINYKIHPYFLPEPLALQGLTPFLSPCFNKDIVQTFLVHLCEVFHNKLSFHLPALGSIYWPNHEVEGILNA